jgi:cytochrome oxidase Cu insertion factor (SCO1/SenC/PrrC family)
MVSAQLRRLILVAAGLAIALALVISAASLYRQLSERDSGLQATIGGPFELVSSTGERVSDTRFRGHHMLVYFGYTFCPDVCPTELATMSQALDLLGDSAQEVQPVFITIDPARDTPAVLADYRQHFNPALTMLTGSEQEIAAVAKAYKVYYARAGDPGDESYLMDHSSFVYLMDRDGHYVTHFGPDVGPEEMAKRIGEAL